MSKLNVLIACEESQTFTKIFRNLGHNAFSCDIKKCSGGFERYHIQADAREIAHDRSFSWDLMIAHPPCTFLSGAGRQWLSHPLDKHLDFFDRRDHPKFPKRREQMYDSLEFVSALAQAPIQHIALENPLGILNSKQGILKDLVESMFYHDDTSFMLDKPCIIQPYQFGDHYQKRSCYWLKNLDRIIPTVKVENQNRGEMLTLKNGQQVPLWFNRSFKNAYERKEIRSKNYFQKMSLALACQFIESIEKRL